MSSAPTNTNWTSLLPQYQPRLMSRKRQCCALKMRALRSITRAHSRSSLSSESRPRFCAIGQSRRSGIGAVGLE